jgi:hypothetical protein
LQVVPNFFFEYYLLMFFFTPPFMVEALSHFLWPDSSDLLLVFYSKHQKPAGNPLRCLSKPAPAFTFLNFTSYWARFAVIGYVPLKRKLLPKKSDKRHSF